jgi:hypothetical protein
MYGFPDFVSSTVMQSAEDIEQYLLDYFQPTIKRQNMIEWLILNINPQYSLDLQSKANKKKSSLSPMQP